MMYTVPKFPPFSNNNIIKRYYMVSYHMKIISDNKTGSMQLS